MSLELDYEALRSEPSKRKLGRSATYNPDVAKARHTEQQRRKSAARQRVGNLLAKMHSDEFEALYPQALAEVHRERGPLPGDVSENGTAA